MGKVWEWQDGNLLLAIRVQPRSSVDSISIQGDELKVRITAPPVEGKANEYLVRYLSKVFGVSKSHIELLSGETSRRKRIRVLAPTRLPSALEAAGAPIPRC